jgi:Met-zincin
VIHWGYAPIPGATTPSQETTTLNRWASASSDPRYRFASDEDVEWDGHAVDPRTAQFMLTNNPPAWCDTELGIYRNLLGSLDSRLPRAQQPWDHQRFAFNVLMNEWNRCAGSMTHYIGGEYLSRNRIGDTGVKSALTPVPRSLEVAAFHDLDRYLFAESAWNISPATLQRTVYSEFEPIDNFAYDPTARHDISLTALVGTYQARALFYMFSPLVLQRLTDLPSKSSRPGETMSTADLFAWTQTSIFGDLQSGAMPKTAVRRNLQRTYSRLLAKLATGPWPGVPYDAQAMARLELTSLAGDLRKNLMRNNLDLQTRAHLEAMQVDVNRALDTRTVIPLS